MGQEFIIKSQDLEDKINQLLPSQGGFQAGVDLSASTQIIPIVDLTETAEGSTVRADLQTALSFNSCTPFFNQANSSNIITTTGTFRVKGTAINVNSATAGNGRIRIEDTAGTNKTLFFIAGVSGSVANSYVVPFDFLVKLEAGDVVISDSGVSDIQLQGTTRQIADLAGNLIDP